MNRWFLRGVALALAPCLIAEPSFANSARSTALTRIAQRSILSERFEDQALIEHLVSGSPRARGYLREGDRMTFVGLARRFSVPALAFLTQTDAQTHSIQDRAASVLVFHLSLRTVVLALI